MPTDGKSKSTVVSYTEACDERSGAEARLSDMRLQRSVIGFSILVRSIAPGCPDCAPKWLPPALAPEVSAKAVRRPEALPESLWGTVHHVFTPPHQNDLDVKEIVNL